MILRRIYRLSIYREVSVNMASDTQAGVRFSTAVLTGIRGYKAGGSHGEAPLVYMRLAPKLYLKVANLNVANIGMGVRN